MITQELVYLTEIDFIKMFSQRQNTELWRSVAHLTAIFREPQNFLKVYKLKFITSDYKNHPLFLKAKNYLQDLQNNFNEDDVVADYVYVSKLVQSSPLNYCIYAASKIIWFFEIVRKRHIKKIMIDFVRTSEKEYWIKNIKNIHHCAGNPDNLARFYMKKIEYRDEAYKQKELHKLNRPIFMDIETWSSNKEKKFQQLEETCGPIRKALNDKIIVDEGFDDRPDKGFKLFHPHYNFTLTEFLENKVEKDKVIKQLATLYYTNYQKKGPYPGPPDLVKKYKRHAPTQEEVESQKQMFFFSRNKLFNEKNPPRKDISYHNPFINKRLVQRASSLKLLRGESTKGYRLKQVREEMINRLGPFNRLVGGNTLKP